MNGRDNAKGPYIVWLDYGCEGWQPYSYDTIKEAVDDVKYQSTWAVTKVVEYDVVEKG